MLSAGEFEVMDKIVEAWNAFVALPRCHPMELQEGCTFVHGLQGLLMNRAAVRAHPETFHHESGFDLIPRERPSLEDRVESLSLALHCVYQEEAHRQGDVRHAESFEALADNVKEFDRVLARFILANFIPKAGNNQ